MSTSISGKGRKVERTVIAVNKQGHRFFDSTIGNLALSHPREVCLKVVMKTIDSPTLGGNGISIAARGHIFTGL